MRIQRIVVAVALGAGVIGGGGCSRTQAKLVPAPGAATVPGRGRGAAATAAGVRVVARAGAWEWNPTNLETEATPILIQLANDGSVPMLIRYDRITLTDEAGHRFAAMPPYDVNATITQPFTVVNPYYGFSRFSVAPYLRRWYPGFAGYGGAFGYDAAYYSPYITRYARVDLPTADMVQRALPEGVLSPGGRAQGFVYFERLDRDAGEVTLAVDIVDASSGSTVATAHIPFMAR